MRFSWQTADEAARDTASDADWNSTGIGNFYRQRNKTAHRSPFSTGKGKTTALHPQTLLAYEMNGKPLTPDHGAPLRLVTPLKYGVKQIKQIGRITYVNTRPRDYWHEQGYDYYAGL